MQYPKILLISPYNIFEDNDATSISIRSILKNWPKEKIVEILFALPAKEATIAAVKAANATPFNPAGNKFIKVG